MPLRGRYCSFRALINNIFNNGPSQAVDRLCILLQHMQSFFMPLYTTSLSVGDTCTSAQKSQESCCIGDNVCSERKSTKAVKIEVLIRTVIVMLQIQVTLRARSHYLLARLRYKLEWCLIAEPTIYLPLYGLRKDHPVAP